MNIPDDATAARYNRSYAKMVEFVGRMYKAGVPIVAGTDEIAGFTLQRELELYVAGRPDARRRRCRWRPGTARSTRACSTTAVRSCRASAPTSCWSTATRPPHIGDIRKVALVLKGDTAYYPSEIHEALGIKPFTTALKVAAAK